jgi:hypothetical protein
LWLIFLCGMEEDKEKGNLMAFHGRGGLVEKEISRGSDWAWMREGGGVPLAAGFGDAVGDQWPAAHGRCRGGRRSSHVSRGVGCR